MPPRQVSSRRWRVRASSSASATDERQFRSNRATVVAGFLIVAAISVGAAGLGPTLLAMTVFVLVADASLAASTTRDVVIAGSITPNDLVVGDSFTLELAVTGLRMPLTLELPSDPEPITVVVDAPGSGTIEATARRRGVMRSVQLKAHSSGLSGLITCVRTHKAPISRHVDVGPRPVVPTQPLPDLGGGWGEGATAAAPDAELVRGLRDYVPGDRMRQVHWRATARHGELVVKETEEPQSPVLHVVLDLGAGGDAGEAAAGRAAWYAREALQRGYQVTLTTMERKRSRTEAVPSSLVLNRRLARAGRGGPPLPETIAPRVRVLLVSDEGDSWP